MAVNPAVNFIPFVFPGVPCVRCAFQIRTGPDSPSCLDDPWQGGNISFSVGDEPGRVAACRTALAKALGLEAPGADTHGLAEADQVHGDALLFEPSPVRPGLSPDGVPSLSGLPKGDGLATTRPGVGLMIKTADCQPVLLAHAGGRHVAALHVGWRGNRIGFIPSAVRAFCSRYDLRPGDLSAVRGPSLGPSRSEFVNFDQEWGPDFESWYDKNSRTMNLWRLTGDQLREAGLAEERIFGLDLCTASLDAFFSYRRQRVTGRQASVIFIEP